MEYLLLNIYFIIIYIFFHEKVKHGYHMLQLESYKNERYNKWIKNNIKKEIKIRELLLIIPIIMLFFSKPISLILIIFIVTLLYLSKNEYKEKKAFVVTSRIKRMYITQNLILLILFIISNILINNTIYLAITLLISIIFIFISNYIVILINSINSPIEKKIQKTFYNKAKQKLKSMPNLKIIGITGSYGKTSTKHIVSTILAQKYNVLMTPESYNTTMGVVRTINEKLKSTHEVFVCEMGAKNIGDIKEICDLVKPQYGILTSIGEQHLETFKTLDNIKKTKLELIESLPENGIAFINGEDENIEQSNIQKNTIKYGLNNTMDYYAHNIELIDDGSIFNIYAKDTDISVKSKLLGQHNIVNIVSGVAVTKELGLSIEEIKLGVRNIKPVQHRLELRKNPNGSIIIDDAYNSNRKGAKMALDVLKSFENKQRILITPGIVDLGDKSYEYNKELGILASTSSDFVILVGKEQTKPIYDGLKQRHYEEEKIYIAKDLTDAISKMNEISSSNSVILLENDLPDNYIDM